LCLLEAIVSSSASWKDAVVDEVEAAANRDQAVVAHEAEVRQEAEDRRDAFAEEGEAVAKWKREALASEGRRRGRAEDRFDEFLAAFEREGGIRRVMASIVAELKDRGLDSELQEQVQHRDSGQVASCMAAIRIRSLEDASAHGSVVIVASDDHDLELLEVVQSRARQRETEEGVALGDLTEARIGESVLAVVREILRR
jgi:hypothetical protein